MSLTRKQHYVPQFYLRNFSCNGKSVGTHIISSSKTVQSASIADGFCDGALLSFFEDGSIRYWLERL
jgi:hypothetical protein